MAGFTVATGGVGAAIAGSFMATAAATVGLTGYAYAAAYYATSFMVSSTLNNMLSGAIGGGDGGGGQAQSVAAQAQARMQMLRTPAGEREIVYGLVLKSGQLVHAVAKTEAGVDWLYLVIVVAGHQINYFSDFYINDTWIMFDGKSSGQQLPFDTAINCDVAFTGFISARLHPGTTTQSADTDLMAFDTNWTANHKLSGLAYATIKLKYDQSKFPTGIPNIRMLVEGKLLYDPRVGGQRTTTPYLHNPALQVYDYLINYMGVDSASIDTTSFNTAADICEEHVPRADGTWNYRYLSSGVIKSSMTHRDAIKMILSTCGGTLACPQGKYTLHVAAYTAPVTQLNEDILRGPMRVRAAVSKKNLFNAVRGQYVNPNNYWQPSDFPALINTTYAADDGGEQIFADLQLPFTTDKIMAMQLAKIALEKSRQGITIEMPCTLAALKLKVMDNVLLNISHLGWDFDYLVDEIGMIDEWGWVDEIGGKVFKITSMTMSDNGGVDLTLQEEAAGCYEWNFGNETSYDLAPNTTLPDVFAIDPPGNVQMTEALYETTGSAGVKNRATITWDAPNTGFIVDYELEYKLHADATWKEIFNIRGTSYEFTDIAAGTYDFRVKSRNIMNVASDYTPVKTFTVYGLTVAPGDVAEFSVVSMNGMALATWDATADLDVKIGGHVQIRHSPLTSGADFSDGITYRNEAGDVTYSTLPLASGTYMAKFVDSTGNFSDTTATFVITEDIIGAWTTVATSTQDDTFTGTKTGCEVSSPNLIMSGTNLTATYEFDTYLDMTTVATRRYYAHIKVRAYNATGTVDSTDTFDSTEAFNETGEIQTCNALLQISTTADDPAGAPTWSAWKLMYVADLSARAVKFRLKIGRANAYDNIEIQELSVVVKTPT